MLLPCPDFWEIPGNSIQEDRNAHLRSLPPILKMQLKFKDNCAYLPPKAAKSLIIGDSGGFDKVYVGDTRVLSEYEKSHIKGSFTFKKQSDIDSLLSITKNRVSNICVLLYSQCSSFHASLIYKLIRSTDRNMCIHSHRSLILADLYIIEGGYDRFSRECPDLCTPEREFTQQIKLKDERRNWTKEFARGKSFRYFSSDIFETTSLYCRSRENISPNLLDDIKMSTFNASQPNILQ